MEYPGARYHGINRGDRREAIVRDDQDRELFLATLGEACAKADGQVQAYCLIGHHFHVVAETPPGNLVAGMKGFLGTFTARLNRRHKLVGHLFSGRSKALVVDAASPGDLRTVCDYVHLNPVRAKRLRAASRGGPNQASSVLMRSFRKTPGGADVRRRGSAQPPYVGSDNAPDPASFRADRTRLFRAAG